MSSSFRSGSVVANLKLFLSFFALMSLLFALSFSALRSFMSVSSSLTGVNSGFNGLLHGWGEACVRIALVLVLVMPLAGFKVKLARIVVLCVFALMLVTTYGQAWLTLSSDTTLSLATTLPGLPEIKPSIIAIPAIYLLLFLSATRVSLRRVTLRTAEAVSVLTLILILGFFPMNRGYKQQLALVSSTVATNIK